MESQASTSTVDQPPEGWRSARFVHVQGGVRVINGFEHQARIEPAALNRKSAQFDVAAYHHLFHSIHELLKWKIIGVDFVSHVLEADRRVPPNWRTFLPPVASPWIVDDTILTWRNISNAAHEKRDGRLWDLASRIAYQLRLCSWRLRQLSDVYSDCLTAKVRDGEFKVGSAFDDGFVQLGYFEVQSLLIDGCILRDALAEFTANYVYATAAANSKARITTMSGLRERILKKQESPEALAVELLAASSDGGWLYDLGAYRDLIIHAAPIVKAERRLLALTGALPLAGSPGVPTITLPLPADPNAIRSSRSMGNLFDDFDEQVRRFAGSVGSPGASRDALEYAHFALGGLATWASELSRRSPIAPVMPHFDASNIIGPVVIKRV